MSHKSDNAPVRFERTDYDNAGAITVQFVINGQQRRASVEFPDDCIPSLAVYKFNTLAMEIMKMLRDGLVQNKLCTTCGAPFIPPTWFHCPICHQHGFASTKGAGCTSCANSGMLEKPNAQ